MKGKWRNGHEGLGMARKKIWMILCITAALCAAGCSSGEGSSSGKMASIETAAPDTEAENGEEKTDESITGQATAVSGKEITLALVEMPERGEGGPGGDGQQPPERPEGVAAEEGEEPPERPEDGTAEEGEGPPERPEDGTAEEGEEPPERPEDGTKAEGGEMPKRPEDGKGGAPGGVNATGEEKTITVSEETVYALDERGESRSASLEDIGEGNLLRVVMDGDKVVSVTIMKMGQSGTGNGDRKAETDEEEEHEAQKQ